MRRMTRRQVQAWFIPIRHALKEMLMGEVDSVRGYAVTKLHTSDDYARVDHCIAGFVGVLTRIFPEVTVTSLTRLQKRLACGVPVTEDEIQAALTFLNDIETPLIKADWHKVKDALQTEMIAIELSDLGVAA